jgi:4-diphosphocytidyl-2C-methyl-D-erythritol kinase
VNDLELPVFHYYPELNHIREKLEDFGALAGRLTGSGPTIYGLFGSTEEAEAAKSKLDVYQLDRVPEESNPIYPLDSWVVESSCQGARLV